MRRPRAIRVDPWCEQFIEVRAPAAVGTGQPVAILPLDDGRQRELGVVTCGGLDTPDEKGNMRVKVLNASTKPVYVPMLAPLARFIVDPKISEATIEKTSLQDPPKHKACPG